jgi:DNA integrity scanning protein DisA with diadenylate cyclase activity
MEELRHSVNGLLQNGAGALIVLMKNSEMKYYLKTGVPIEAQFSSPLVNNIFFKNSPLHDGAIFVKGATIKAARCILPLSEKTDFPDNLGLRHRAALGITEFSDAVAIIVSEQYQQVSVAYHGQLGLNLDMDELMEKVEKYLSEP